jgi:hypothetical protein
MKFTTAYAIIWISCSIAISIGIIVSKSLMPLWAFLIPTLISVESKEGE